MKLLNTVSIQLLFTFLCSSCFVKCLHHFFSTFPMGILKINDVTGGNALQPCINLTLQHECVSPGLVNSCCWPKAATPGTKPTKHRTKRHTGSELNSKFACRWAGHLHHFAIQSHVLLNQVGPMLHGL